MHLRGLREVSACLRDILSAAYRAGLAISAASSQAACAYVYHDILSFSA